MFVESHIMKKLIQTEKRSKGSYTSVADQSFLGRYPQSKVIAVCKTLASEEGLVEWENDSDLSLKLRVTELGRGYFARKRFNRKSYWAGVASGIIATVISGLIITVLTGQG